MDTQAFQNAGFEPNASLKADFQAYSDRNGLSANGRHEIVAAFRKGNVTVVVERNTVQQHQGYGVTYPAVCVLTGPHGKVACDPTDIDLAVHLASTLG